MKIRSQAIPLALALFLGLVYLFAWSPVFAVRSIETTGLPPGVSENAIIKKSNIAVGEKLSRIEPRSAERAISEISWVEKVSISRNWINGKVALSLTSRRPIGIYKGRAVDSTGALFDFPGKLPKGLPTVTASTPSLGLVAIELFTHLPSELRDKTTSVSASGESAISSWQVESGRNVKVTWGSSNQLDLKVSVLKALLALPENKLIKRVDLSAPHAPIVK